MTEETEATLRPLYGRIQIDYHFTNDDGEVEHHTLTRDLDNDGLRRYLVGDNGRTAEMTHAEASRMATGLAVTLKVKERHRQNRLRREYENG